MSFSVKVTTSSVTVRDSNHVEVERIVRLFDGEREIAKAVDKYVIAPGDDIKDRTDRAAMIAKTARTASDEVETPTAGQAEARSR